jgi:exonuclease SbcD|tara:strand:+ start:1024 stop:2088 length:1065 start_codon:yes stop_codon:yes gene_type:complete
MEKPIFLASTDWHFTNENSKEIYGLIEEKFKLAISLGLKEVFMLGDVFVSRISQRMEILDSFWDILNLAKEYGIIMYVIPGNHDKTDYKSDRSFLRFYSYHPNIRLVENHLSLIRGEYEIHLMPYFTNSSEKFKDNFDKCLSPTDISKKQILMSHFAVQGSINNDGTKIEKGCSVSEFKSFEMVFLGHYHNTHNVSSNILHIPSLRQNNFGEDDKKGFTIMFEDGEIELVSPNFTKYIKVKLDLDEVKFNDLFLEAEKYSKSNPNDNVRFVVTGEENLVRSLETSRFTNMGIDIRKNIKSLVPELSDSPNVQEIVEWTKSDVMERFKKYCIKGKLDLDYGNELIIKIIGRNVKG